MSKTPWTTLQETRDRSIGWCDAQAGRPFDPTASEAWKAGYLHWPKRIKPVPTLSQQMSQIQKRILT